MDRLLVIEPRDLVFKFELEKKSHATIQLRNVMHTMPVAFLVQPASSAAPKRYAIKPAHGIIPPLRTAVVAITLNSQSEIPTCIPCIDDQFLVKSVVVVGRTMYDSVSLDWFTARKKQVYTDHGIRVFFIGGCILRKLLEVGNMENIRMLLEFDENLVDCKDEQGCTALHAAVARGRPDLVQLFLEFGVDADSGNRMGNTALHDAAIRGEVLIAELLLAKGASWDAKTMLGQTALYLAVSKGHVDVAKLLVEHGADVNEQAGDGTSLLQLAVEEARYDCLEMLLKMGANVNTQLQDDGNSALHRAVKKADMKAMEILLRHGAGEDAKNMKGAIFVGDNAQKRSWTGNPEDVQENPH